MGYNTYSAETNLKTATLVRARETEQAHTLPTRMDNTFVEIIPNKKTLTSLFILNVYSKPSPSKVMDIKYGRNPTKGTLTGLLIFSGQPTLYASPIQQGKK